MNGSPALLRPNDFHEPATAEFPIGAWRHFRSNDALLKSISHSSVSAIFKCYETMTKQDSAVPDRFGYLILDAFEAKL